MVTVNPPLLEALGFFLDPSGMALLGLGTLTSTNTTTMASSLSEDPNKKIRKPYTITKSRESWTEQEHDKFLEALQLEQKERAPSFIAYERRRSSRRRSSASSAKEGDEVSPLALEMVTASRVKERLKDGMSRME